MSLSSQCNCSIIVKVFDGCPLKHQEKLGRPLLVDLGWRQRGGRDLC